MKLKLFRNSLIGCLLMCALVAVAHAGNVEFVIDKAQRDYPARFRSTYHLGTQFSDGQIDAMIRFLHRIPTDDVVKPNELASLKNNVADVLIEQKTIAPLLLEEFLAMYDNQNLGATWRNYVVQKMAPICLQLDEPGKAVKGVDFLRRIARDVQAGYVCEAFLALDRICSARPTLLSADKLCLEAVSALTSDKVSPEDKGIILQVWAHYDGPAARQKAITFLLETSSSMLKACALATLAKVGRPEDIGVVKRFTDSPDGRIGEAARVALKNLQGALAADHELSTVKK